MFPEIPIMEDNTRKNMEFLKNKQRLKSRVSMNKIYFP